MRVNWPALRVEFVTGLLSLTELAEKHGIKPNTVQQRAHREAWKDKRQDASEAVVQRAESVIAVTKVDELARFNDDDLKMARAIRARAARMMGGNLTPLQLRSLASAVESAQKIGRLALGASTENRAVLMKSLPPSVDGLF